MPWLARAFYIHLFIILQLGSLTVRHLYYYYHYFLQCNYGNCQATFHPSCARSSGFYMHVKTLGGKIQHKGYCEKHSVEQRAKVYIFIYLKVSILLMVYDIWCLISWMLNLCRLKHKNMELRTWRTSGKLG